MSLTRKFLVLSSIAALSFCFAACDDDSDSNDGGDDVKECTSADNKCSGYKLLKCNETTKQIETIDCAASGQTCDANALACKSDCSASDNKCDGTVLYSCNASSKKLEKVDCASINKICDKNALMCKDDNSKKPAGTECTQDKCSEEDETIIIKCDNGYKVPTPCGEFRECNLRTNACETHHDCENGQTFCNQAGTGYTYCKNYTISTEEIPCEQGAKCEFGACVKPFVKVDDDNAIIGKACHCEGNDCFFTINGKEVKTAITDTTIGILKSDSIAVTIPDDAVVKAPNYFSDGIKGCEGLKAPAGMAVGCFRTETITFPEWLLTLMGKADKILNNDLVKLLIGSKLEGKDINGVINSIAEVVAEGIKFEANNGYCLLANIDIDLKVNSSLIETFITMKNVKPLLEKINTPNHDHIRAKAASCPDGSRKLTYDMSSFTEDMGSAEIGFDLCLKGCETNSDCREADGMKCVELPYGTAEDVKAKAHTAKVCFPEANIEYFEKMTALLPTD